MPDEKKQVKDFDDISQAILSFVIISGKPLKKSDISALFKLAHRYIYRQSNRNSNKYKVNASLLTSTLKNLIESGYLGESPIYYIPKNKNKLIILNELVRESTSELAYLHQIVRQQYHLSYWGYYNNTGIVQIAIGELLYCIATDKTYDFQRNYVSLTQMLDRLRKSEQEFFEEFELKLSDTSESGYFNYLNPNVSAIILGQVTSTLLENLIPWNASVINKVNTHLQAAPYKKDFDSVLTIYLAYLLMWGKFDEIKNTPHDLHDNSFYLMTLGCVYLFEGNYQVADETFKKALFAHKSTPNQDKSIPAFSMSIFYFMSFARKYGAGFKKLETGVRHFASYSTTLLPAGENLLTALSYFVKNKVNQAKSHLEKFPPESFLETVLYTHLMHWLEGEVSFKILNSLEDILEKSVENNVLWLQMETRKALALFSKVDKLKEIHEKQYQALATQLGCVSLINLVPKLEAWERTLTSMESFFKKEKSKDFKVEDKTKRLVFFADFDRTPAEFEIKIQIISKKGGWTKGKKASYGDLQNYMSDEANIKEKRIINLFSSWEETEDSISYSNYYYEPDKLFSQLVDFPHIYHAKNTNVQLSLSKAEPAVSIEETDDAFNVQLKYLPTKEGVNVLKDSPTSYSIVDFSEDQYEILSYFSSKEISFPKKVGTKLLGFIDQLKELIPVESLLEKDVSELKQQDGDSRPNIHLLPTGSTFQIDIFSKPVKDINHYFLLGSGKTRYVEYINDGEKILVNRNLSEELRQTKEVLSLLNLPKKGKTENLCWSLETPQECLRVLSALSPLRAEEKVVVEWPKGEKLKVVGQLNSNDMELRISKGKDYWFKLDGEIKVNENLVFSLQKLLELTEQNESNFIEISDGQFLSLTTKLQKQLKASRAILQKGKDDGMQFHNLAGSAIESLFDDAQLESDKFWKEQQQRLAKAKKIRPKVPKDFQANLRPYQDKGFRWMMQLAEWGVGGCLADDMGLGKTIQGLSVLCARSKEGPAFVVAPASVCRNWLREAEKFAPQLRPQLFGQGDRAKMLKGIKKGDLLITSYGLMQTEIEKLSQIEFGTIILDEAQAIKNYNTKRFKAAVQLNGKLKMATTGTPVENHLGELWSLFHFINPGLLGSKSYFIERFGAPITNGDKGVMQSLKNLVKPFILRRKKSQVLKDLPAKTEIIYNVEMSAEERAFYEAARRNAVQKLEEGADEQKAGTQHLLVLAEITRMRRACCHPSLVDKSTKLPGAKLEAVKEIIHDLRDNGHKVLVFSQFVDYLRIVEDWVKKEKISYQYLDGSTPMKKRELAVNAFQKGEGDLFLISLKAGGVGLNLTEADYVIILDPWWNPAVEDQAADRAHRIGQTRPVTVYRMVIENTIEEKIVQLHAQKRDLADTLLKGTDSSSKITTKDLMEILQAER